MLPITIGTRTLLAKTCIGCGELKQGDEYHRATKIYLQSNCKSCRSKPETRVTTRNHQERSIKGAVKHRQSWTEQEIKTLLQMDEDGYSGPSIAYELERSVYSVYTKLHKLKKDGR